MHRLIGVALALLLTLGAALATEARDRIWRDYTRFTSPYLQRLPDGEISQPQTRRLIVLIVRGLRTDIADQMPTLSALRKRGAAITLEHDSPTWRLPVWITLFTGAQTRIHGSTSDSSPRNPDIDSLFARMAAAGQNSAIIGTSQWNELYGSDTQRVEVIDADNAALRDELASSALLQTLKDPSAPERLIVAEFTLIEDAIRSAPETLPAAAAAVDIRIQAIERAADLNNNTLAVLGDRGLSNDGREGGGEADLARVPLVIAGTGVRPGTEIIAPALDLAPTLAMLLGVAPPAHAQGAPMWDAISSRAYLAAARQSTAFFESWSEVSRRPRFAAEVLQDYDADLRVADDNARARFDTWRADLALAADRQREARLDEERSARLPLVIIVLIFMLLITGIVLNNSIAPPLIGLVVFAAGWVIDFYLVRGLTASFSFFQNGQPTELYALVLRDSALLTMLATLFSAVFATRLCDSLAEVLTAAVGAQALIAIAQLLQFLWYYWRWGDGYSWTIPDAGAVAAVLIALTQSAALSISIIDALPALPLPLLALVIGAGVWVLSGRAQD